MNKCIDNIEKNLFALPKAWRKQVATAICTSSDVGKLFNFNCDDVKKCETLTTLSNFTVNGTSVCISFKDEHSVVVTRCFDFADILNNSIKDVNPRCLASGSAWVNMSYVQKFQVMVDKLCQDCQEVVSGTSSTTSTTTIATTSTTSTTVPTTSTTTIPISTSTTIPTTSTSSTTNTTYTTSTSTTTTAATTTTTTSGCKTVEIQAGGSGATVDWTDCNGTYSSTGLGAYRVASLCTDNGGFSQTSGSDPVIILNVSQGAC